MLKKKKKRKENYVPNRALNSRFLLFCLFENYKLPTFLHWQTLRNNINIKYQITAPKNSPHVKSEFANLWHKIKIFAAANLNRYSWVIAHWIRLPLFRYIFSLFWVQKHFFATTRVRSMYSQLLKWSDGLQQRDKPLSIPLFCCRL